MVYKYMDDRAIVDAVRMGKRKQIPYSGKYTNNRVIYSWMNCRPWHSLSMRTDGKSIYSYYLEIGKTDEKGDKVLLDYTAPGLGYHSHTTSHHVNLTRCVADRVVSK
eukprot:SAG22_NODE_288_length_12949_cov_163.316265_19_plen_107_part_00